MEPSEPSPTDGVRAAKRRRVARRCACDSLEGCFACGRCLERHCVCGAAQRSTQLCRESRACNCRVVAPATARCVLCGGCRQPNAQRISHCRCVAHQQLWRARTDAKKEATVATIATTATPCDCFDDKRLLATKLDPVQARTRRRVIARIKRRAGLPTSRGLYATKIVAHAVGVDAFGEECDELSDTDDAGGLLDKPTGTEELEDAVHPVYIERSRPPADGHMPQGPLSWSSSQPYQQALAAPPTRHTEMGRGRLAKTERVTHNVVDETVDRTLDNAVFTLDRDAASPSEALVDYLLFAASVKASRIPELIGTFDDTAATALGVVVEEYMKQLVLRAAHEPLCANTRRAIQAFAVMMLDGFNYAQFVHQCGLPPVPQLTADQAGRVVDTLACLVHDEYRALHPPVDEYQVAQQIGCIRAVVVSEVESVRATAREGPSNPHAVSGPEKLKALKLSQHVSKITGQRVYKYEMAADVGSRHHAKVALDGFESREAADQSIQRMRRVLEHQDKRLSEIEKPKVHTQEPENPMINELYEQLANQVRQARSAQTGNPRDASGRSPSEVNAVQPSSNSNGGTETQQ